MAPTATALGNDDAAVLLLVLNVAKVSCFDPPPSDMASSHSAIALAVSAPVAAVRKLL